MADDKLFIFYHLFLRLLGSGSCHRW